MAGVIPTRELLTKRLGGGDIGCVLCGAEVETIMHLFKDCHCIRAMAFGSNWGCNLNFWSPSNIEEWILCGLDRRSSGGTERRGSWNPGVFFGSLLYSLWKFRNDSIFTFSSSLKKAIFGFNLLVDEFQAFEDSGGHNNTLPSPRPASLWSSPPPVG